MNPIITFFRDILDGTTYIIVCSISAVLLCACIGYLAEKKSKNKEQTVTITPQANAPSEPIQTSIEQVQPQVLLSQNDNLISAVTPVETMPQSMPIQTEQQPVAMESEPTQQVQTPLPTDFTTSPVDIPKEQQLFPPVDNGANFTPVGTTQEIVESVPQTMQIPTDQTPITTDNQVTAQFPFPAIDNTAVGQSIETSLPQQDTTQQTFPAEQSVHGTIPQQDQPIFPPMDNQISVPTMESTVPTMEAANLEVPQINNSQSEELINEEQDQSLQTPQLEETVETITEIAQANQIENVNYNNQEVSQQMPDATPLVGDQPVMPQINDGTTQNQNPLENLPQ